MIASRGDVLPADIIAELSKLQSEAAPFPWLDAALMIKSELGKEPEQLFATIEHEPFAAASTAQVHRATLHDGTLVAVKVQRPQIIAKTKADLGVITELASIAERRVGIARKVGLRAMVAEFASGVLKELDYTNEAYHAKRLADNMAKFPEITVPRVYDELSSSRVLTMEFIAGIKVSNAEALREAGFDTDVLGAAFVRAVIKQILIDGFFHGDPHPGNLMAEPATKRLVFLDLGLVGQLKATQRVDLLGLIYALKSTDIGGIADGLLALGKPTKDFDEEQFRTDIDRLARQYLVYGGVTSVGEALSGFMGAVFDNGLRLDSSLTLAIKAIIQTEQTATILAPDVDLASEAMREAQEALLESLEPDRVAKQLSSHGGADRQGAGPPDPDPGGRAPQVARRREPGKAVRRGRRARRPQGRRGGQRHRPPGDRRADRGGPADRHGDRDVDPAPAGPRRLHRVRVRGDDRVRRDAGRQLRRPVPDAAGPRGGGVARPECAAHPGLRRRSLPGSVPLTPGSVPLSGSTIP